MGKLSRAEYDFFFGWITRHDGALEGARTDGIQSEYVGVYNGALMVKRIGEELPPPHGHAAGLAKEVYGKIRVLDYAVEITKVGAATYELHEQYLSPVGRDPKPRILRVKLTSPKLEDSSVKIEEPDPRALSGAPL